MNCAINDDANVTGFCHGRDRVNLIARESRSTRFDVKVIRFLLKLVLCAMLALAAGFAYLAVRSGDTIYTFYEWMSPARFHQYDRLIRAVAAEHHLDPMLVKAVVWRESRFDPRKHGSHGERGLMQVSEKGRVNGQVKIRSPIFKWTNFLIRKPIWRLAHGICIAPLNAGRRSQIPSPLLSPNTTRAPVVWNGGAAAAAPLTFR